MKRDVTQSEFQMTLSLFRKKSDNASKYKYPCMLNWQYHLINRLDDTCHARRDDPHGHPTFQYALEVKVAWSKNVMEERQCPPQILFGSNDPENCILIALAIYLEQDLEWHQDAEWLFTSNLGEDAPINLKSQWRKRLEKDVWNHADFKALTPTTLRDNGIGTHSYRKYPTTKARRHGMSIEQCEVRGRWKSQGSKVVNRYINPAQLYDDAKVAETLCYGGAVAYVLEEGFEFVIDDWLMTHVLPHIAARYGNDRRMCRVLGYALLYVALEDSLEYMLPLPMKQRICAAYIIAANGKEGNPIKKIPVVVYRISDNLRIDLVPGGGNPPAGDVLGAVPPMAQGMQEQINALLIQNNQLQQQLAVTQQNLERMLAEHLHWHEIRYTTINDNIRRFGGTVVGAFARQDPAQAGNRRAAEAELQAAPAVGVGSATLSNTPRTLIDLWNEFKFGLGGRKAAERFTSQERGHNKQKYYRRKFVWDCMGELIRQGLTAQGASERIHQVYGENKSVTQIINCLIHDWTTRGGHPNLPKPARRVGGGGNRANHRAGRGGVVPGRGAGRGGGRGHGGQLVQQRLPAIPFMGDANCTITI